MLRGREWRHARKRWAEDLGIWKKNSELRFGRGRNNSIFGARRGQTSWGSTKCAAHLLKKLCLYFTMSKNLKHKKVIKSFVAEPISCFRIPMFMNICERFPYPYEYVYFTCSYLGRIFLDVYILVAERNLYFCLARNLIWLLESPNIFTESGWPLLFSPNHISKQHQKLKKAHESLSLSLPQKSSMGTDVLLSAPE